MPWVDLQFVIVVFPGNTHLLFYFYCIIEQTFNRKGPLLYHFFSIDKKGIVPKLVRRPSRFL